MYKKIFKSILTSSKLNLGGLYKTEDNSVMARKPHFIFSAENPMYPENHIYTLSHEKVVSMLKGKGYQVEEARGHYGKPERSIIVHNTNPTAVKHLQNLARGLGQESSIASDGYSHEMHFHGGENEGLHIKGQGTTIHKRKPDDHFTEMKDGMSFSHIFNFDEAHPKESSAFKQPTESTKKTEVDFVKSEPNHPLVNPHPDTKLIHFSTTGGLKEIDPKFQGVRIKDASSKRGQPEHPVSFFYLEGAKPEALVTGGSTSKYTARLGNRKVYDLGTDPDHIRHGLREASKNRQINPGSFTRDELDSAIKAKGYHGVYNSAHESEDMRHVVGMYHPTPVEKEVPFHPRDAERATDAAHEQHHSLQKASRLFLEDIEKGGVTSPSKFTGVKQLKQIQQHNGLGAGGKEYDMDEVKNSLNERGNSIAQKMVGQAGKHEKQMATQAAAGPQPVSFPPPMPGKQRAPTPITSHNPQVRAVADSYAQSRGLKLNHNVPQSQVDPKNAAKIADAYHNAKHTPNDPHVKAAYEALINETKDQYQHMLNSGVKISKMQAGQENPYKTSKDLFHDIKNNNHLAYYPTVGEVHGVSSYGSGEESADHPMLQPTEHLDAEGKPMLANDIFRVVHDYFGHAKEGNGFGANGEEGAWKHHMQMYSPMAQKALTAETRGQNSWVNFGPHGESNRKNPANTRYADQKATILPDWAHQHGEQSIYSSIRKNETDAKIGKISQQKDAVRTHMKKVPKGSELHNQLSNKWSKLNDSHDNLINDKEKSNLDQKHLKQLESTHDTENVMFHGSLNNNLKGFQSNKIDPTGGNYGQKKGVGVSFSPQASYSKQYVTKDGLGSGKKGQVYKIIPEKNSILDVHENPNAVKEAAIKMGVEQHLSSVFGNQPNIQLERAIAKKHPELDKKGIYDHMSRHGIKGFSVGGDYGKEFLVHDPSGFAIFGEDGKLIHPGSGKVAPKNEKSIYSSLKKREVIMMKGAMNRIAPYNPDKHISAEDHSATENWTAEGDDQDARSKVPEMHANAKVRALHKMTGMTQVRKHPKTGERMYLLHRGMGNSEYVQNHQAGTSSYPPGTLTSWTPKYDVAKDFSGDHLEGKTPRVVSAWIPESHIHNIPNQTTIPDENAQFRHEHEVIVNHQGDHPHAHKDVVLQARNPRLFLNNKINMKGQAEQAQKQPFDEKAAFNDQIKRTKRAEEFKRNKFGKREVISMKTLAKGDISSKIKNGVAGLAVAAAAMAPMNSVQDKQPEPPAITQEAPAITQEAPAPVNKRKERILSSIMDVESSNGKNTKHKSMPLTSLHRGESAYGNYGLMPLIIRETIKKNPSLKAHAAAQNLTGDKMHEYMNKNPGLEKQIAEAHYDRLAKQFGDNPQKIGYAWLNGVAGTHKAIKENRPLDKHFHVKKILKAYASKKQGLK